MAYTLRFVLVELFLYQKELYWVGAMLAATSGPLLAHVGEKTRLGRLWAVLLFLAIVAAGLAELVAIAPRFYREYLFL